MCETYSSCHLLFFASESSSRQLKVYEFMVSVSFGLRVFKANV